MLMARPGRTKEESELIEQWLKENEVTRCIAFDRTDPNTLEYKRAWGGRKKKKPAVAKPK
ncbi:MAG: hypothetical protein CMQ88_02155 [Gammaproteobacteria bacterium]|nr:hypothetical protein [Gammaproteobacteria bacterium]